jgi:hypothetical protein
MNFSPLEAGSAPTVVADSIFQSRGSAIYTCLLTGALPFLAPRCLEFLWLGDGLYKYEEQIRGSIPLALHLLRYPWFSIFFRSR